MRSFVQWLFLSLVFALPFVRFFSWRWQGYIVPLSDLIFLGAFPAFALAVLFRQIDFRKSRFYLPLGFYLLALILATVFSQSPRQSFIKLLGEIYLIALAVMTFNLAATADFARKIVSVWLAATGIVIFFSAAALFLFYFAQRNSLLPFLLSHYGTLPPGNYPRIQSTFLNPNMLCNYLNVGVMMALAAFKLKWIKPIWFWIFTTLFAVAAFFTLSPGIGGIALTVGLWLWLDFKDKNRFAAGAALSVGAAIAVLFFAALLISPDLSHGINPSGRVLVWQSAWETFLANPVFGRGVGADAAAVSYLAPSGDRQFLTDAHQLWLNIAAQTGLVGVAAMLCLALYLWRKIKPFRLEDNPAVILRVACGLAFVGAFLYQGLGGSYEDARHLWVLFGLLAGVAELPISIENQSASIFND